MVSLHQAFKGPSEGSIGIPRRELLGFQTLDQSDTAVLTSDVGFTFSSGEPKWGRLEGCGARCIGFRNLRV